MNNEELKQVYNMFSDCWKLFKKYADIRQDEEARWEALIDEADAIINQYGKDNKFVRDLIMAIMSQFERESMKGARINENAQCGI